MCTCDVQMAKIVRWYTFYGIICSEKIEKSILDSVRDIVGNIFIYIYIYHHESVCIQM